MKSLPKGWQDRVHKALEDSGLRINYIQKKKIEDNRTMFQVTVATKEFGKNTYKIGLKDYIIRNATEDQISSILNKKAQKIIKNDSKLNDKEISSVTITRIEKNLLRSRKIPKK